MTASPMTSSKTPFMHGLDAAARIAPAAALGLSLPIIFLALEPFQFGFWQGAEPIVVAFHGCSALCAAALLIVCLRDRARFLDAVMHPYVLAPIVLAAWSALVAPFAAFPLLAILGPPQNGEGALWFANLGVMVACGLLAVREGRQWRVLAIAAVAVGSIVAIFKALDWESQAPLLFWVPDYVAFFGLALPFIAWPHTETTGRWLRIIAIIVAICVLIVSQNRAAQGILVIGAGLIIGASVGGIPTYVGRILRTRMTALFITLVFIVGPFLFIRSDLAIDWVRSLWARHLATIVMEEAQRADPWSLLIGNGWGHTQEALIVHVNTAKQNMFSIRWDLLVGDWFHSHNWIIESLYSAGLPGLFLSAAVFLVLPAFCDRRMSIQAAVYASCLAASTMVWFQLSSTIPFMALAMAAVAGGSPPPPFLRCRGNTVAAVLAGSFAILVAVQVLAAGTLLTYGLKVSAALSAHREPPALTADFHFPQDFRGAEFAFAKAVRERFWLLRESTTAPEKSARPVQRRIVAAIFEDLSERIERRPSPFLVLAGIAAFSDIMTDPALAWLKPDFQSRTALWGRWVKTFLRLAPRRTDIAIAYFSWLITENRYGEVETMTRAILDDDPEDAVALYHLGAALIVNAQGERRNLALAYLRRAFDHGIERSMQIEPSQKDAILRAR